MSAPQPPPKSPTQHLPGARFAGLSIRAMTAADIDAVIAIDRATPGAPHWSLANYETIFDIPYQINDQGPSPTFLRQAFVAVADQNTAAGPNLSEARSLRGFAVIKVVEFDSSSEMELESIVVASDAQRRGIGSALMQAILAHANSSAATVLTLEVRASNNAAIALYERFGLRRSGLRPHYYALPQEDAVLMELHFRR